MGHQPSNRADRPPAGTHSLRGATNLSPPPSSAVTHARRHWRIRTHAEWTAHDRTDILCIGNRIFNPQCARRPRRLTRNDKQSE